MKKGQVNVFLILGILVVVIFGIAIYTGTKVNEKKIDSEFEKVALSPTGIAPIRTYVENLLYTISEETLFNNEDPLDDGVGNFEHDHLLSLDEIKVIIVDYINNNFETKLDLSEFESNGIVIIKQGIDDTIININPSDVTVTLEYPWTIKTGDVKSTISDFKTILFVRLGSVYDVSSYLSDKITNEGTALDPYILKPEDCDYTSDVGGKDANGFDYIMVEINDEVITITDRYTEEFYFQKPFVFEFRIANVADGGC